MAHLFRHPFPTHSPEFCGSTGAFGFVCGFGECRFASAYKIYGILSTLNPLCSLVVCSLFCATLSLSLVSCFWQGACRTCADPDFATDFFGGFSFLGGAKNNAMQEVNVERVCIELSVINR